MGASRKIGGRRICLISGCGKWQVRDSRCEVHAREREEARGSRQERGYDAEHYAIRTRLLRQLAAAEEQGLVMLCWRCLAPLRLSEDLDADHSKVRALEGGKADCLTHSSCNRGKILPPDPLGGISGNGGKEITVRGTLQH